MTGVRSALVIGGGIAGPVAALALQQAGIEASVYEAYDANADGVGGMLTIAPNGLDALRIVGDDAAVRAVGLPMTRTVVSDGRGRRIGAFAGLADLPPSLALWRADLHRAIRDHAVARGVRIEHGKRLLSVDEGPTGVVARFADGSAAEADVLIGADGIRSTVRSLIDPAAPGPGHVPLLNVGAVADLAVPLEPEATCFVFGRRGFMGYWAQPDGRTAWFANLPDPAPMTAARARAIPVADWLDRLRAAYADDQPCRDLIEHTAAEGFTAFGSIEIMPGVPHWHRGRMVLIGDAVHAPSPSSGQGASLAVEDAIQLARCLRDLPDLPTAFAGYERLRRARVEKVAARARRTNNSKALGPAAITAMRLFMPLAMRTFMTPERTLGLEQRHRIDWQLPAKAIG
jgi:2-polyprenyl-6-methoxyphenol hydroxylase-like FAD-dependent oxidoreductase